MRNKIFSILLSLLLTSPVYGFWGDGGAGWAQIPYLAKVLAENYKRYKQLKVMLQQAKQSDNYFRTVHQGLESVTGLMDSLPISDQGVLRDLKSFDDSLQRIAKIYGRVPRSPEAALHSLHDQTGRRIVTDGKLVQGLLQSTRRQFKNTQAAKPSSIA